MKRRICMALALMIALMLSVCAVADEYENAAPTQEMEQEETPVISAGSVDDEVGVAEDADLDDLPEEEPEEEKREEEAPVVTEEPAEEESSEEEPAEEQPEEGESTEEEPADKGSLSEGAGSPEGETEGVPSDEQPDEEPEAIVEAEPVEELPEAEAPVANELTYNGEAQALVSARGAWLYSLDGESYGEDVPTAVDAGEYTVYYKAEADAEPETLTVAVAKADVTFTPPVAAFIEE